MLHHIYFDVLLLCPLVWPAAVDITRNRPAISVKDGLTAGLGAQHCSINLFQSGSQKFGMAGLKVLFTIPPAHMEKIDRFNEGTACTNTSLNIK